MPILVVAAPLLKPAASAQKMANAVPESGVWAKEAQSTVSLSAAVTNAQKTEHAKPTRKASKYVNGTTLRAHVVWVIIVVEAPFPTPATTLSAPVQLHPIVWVENAWSVPKIITAKTATANRTTCVAKIIRHNAKGAHPFGTQSSVNVASAQAPPTVVVARVTDVAAKPVQVTRFVTPALRPTPAVRNTTVNGSVFNARKTFTVQPAAATRKHGPVLEGVARPLQAIAKPKVAATPHTNVTSRVVSVSIPAETVTTSRNFVPTVANALANLKACLHA